MRLIIVDSLLFLASGFSSLSASEDKIASQPPGEPFPWPLMTRLTALEDLVLAIPTATIGKDEKIGAVIHSDPNAEIHIPTKSSESMIFLRLKAGMSVWLSKSVQGMVVADDKRPRRIRISTVSDENGA